MRVLQQMGRLPLHIDKVGRILAASVYFSIVLLTTRQLLERHLIRKTGKLTHNTHRAHGQLKAGQAGCVGRLLCVALGHLSL